MKDKLLSLCKRLRNATHDELLSFMEIEEDVLDRMLLFLIEEGKIEKSGDTYHFLKSSIPERSRIKRQNKNLFLMFQYHSPETIELIIKSFCLGLQTQKTAYLVNLDNSCIADFYTEFRKLIYENQHKILLNYFFEKPQIGRYRIFFAKYAYFYVYNNQVFISDKYLNFIDGKDFSKSEILEFKKTYSYLTRLMAHNTNKAGLHQKLAEGIWRRNKEFEELYFDLKVNLLNIS